MKVIICVDDGGGLMFNNRRQSRDRAVIEDILKLTDGKNLYVNQYSAKLFDGAANICVSANPMKAAQSGDYCFVENISAAEYSDKIEEAIVYNWNRMYPSDFKADFDYKKMTLKDSVDFEGSSHSKITREVYVK